MTHLNRLGRRALLAMGGEGAVLMAVALAFAARRALAVITSGMVFCAMWFALVTFGPGIEGRLDPVVSGYTLLDKQHTDTGGGLSFLPSFAKVRDCTYYGVTWFAEDREGNLTRLQAQTEEDDPSAPITGPVGKRIGKRTSVYPPPGTASFLGYMHHDCGMLWGQTRSILGPFAVW